MDKNNPNCVTISNEQIRANFKYGDENREFRDFCFWLKGSLESHPNKDVLLRELVDKMRSLFGIKFEIEWKAS